MSDRDHTMIEELLSVDALGGLDEADRALLDRERATHGDCEECARAETELAEVAGRLGLALDPVPISPTMADEILRAAGTEVSPELVVVPDPGEAPVAADVTSTDLAERRDRRGGGAWRSLVAVAAAVALFAGGWFVRDAVTGERQLAQVRLVHFTGGAGTMAMAYRPGETGAVLFGSDLPDPGAGHVYEVWMIQGERAPVSGGCLTPKDGAILTSLPGTIGATDTMAVTVESASCPSAPTTDPILTASLA